jgi:acyl carrier protein
MNTAMPLFELIAAVMEAAPSDVTEDSGSDTLAKWDSMREIMLASTLEAEYGFNLTTDEMLDLHSVKSIRKILAAHGIQSIE